MISSIYLSALVLAFSAVQVSGHAAINPALGVQGDAARSDVQRPKTGAECGKVDVAGAIDSSTPVTADASGAFTVDIANFNGGKDGSRSVTMQVDAAGTGANFVNGKVTTNGDPAPKGTGTDQIAASLPAGTTCTGGTSGDLCLASFTTTSGFGNCVVVQQGAGGGAAGNGTAAGGAAAGGAAKGGATAGDAAKSGAAKGSAAKGGAAKGSTAAGNGPATAGGAAKGGAAANGKGNKVNAAAGTNGNAKASSGGQASGKANTNAKARRSDETFLTYVFRA